MNDKKQIEKNIKEGLTNHGPDIMATMLHSQSCPECQKKFQKLCEHGGGGFKIITHLPKCEECKTLFLSIVEHTKTKTIVAQPGE
jgi:hypothetical protein